MRIFLPSGLNINLQNFLRQCGYSVNINSKTNRISFYKRLTSDEYPHFHIYIEKDIDGKNYFSLHLDNKKPSYFGSYSHNAEYSGDLVHSEASKIKQEIFKIINRESKASPKAKKNFFDRLVDFFKNDK